MTKEDEIWQSLTPEEKIYVGANMWNKGILNKIEKAQKDWDNSGWFHKKLHSRPRLFSYSIFMDVPVIASNSKAHELVDKL